MWKTCETEAQTFPPLPTMCIADNSVLRCAKLLPCIVFVVSSDYTSSSCKWEPQQAWKHPTNFWGKMYSWGKTWQESRGKLKNPYKTWIKSFKEAKKKSPFLDWLRNKARPPAEQLLNTPAAMAGLSQRSKMGVKMPKKNKNQTKKSLKHSQKELLQWHIRRNKGNLI